MLYIVYLHVFFGSIALVSGTIAIGAKKGQKLHKQFGKYFVLSMIFTAISAIIASFNPEKLNPYLLSIGLFTLYMTDFAFKILNLALTQKQLSGLKLKSFLMLLVGVSMIAGPALLLEKFNIVLTVFGFIAIVLSINNYRRIMSVKSIEIHRIRLHLGNMTGAYIAALTAFIVVNQIIPGMWAWLLPSVIGVPYIIFNLRKKAV